MDFADLLREGDELLEINGVPVTGKSADDIIALMVCVCVISFCVHVELLYMYSLELGKMYELINAMYVCFVHSQVINRALCWL